MVTMPWGKLGVGVYGNRAETLKRAGLDWRVEKRPVFTEIEDRRVEVRDRAALVRTPDGTPIGVVSADWEPIQNEEAVVSFEATAKSMKGRLRYVGSLKNEVVWGLVSTGLSADVGGRRIESYALLSSSHAYGKAAEAQYLALVMNPAATLVKPIGLTTRASHRSRANEEIADRVQAAITVEHEHTTRALAKLAEARPGNVDALYAETMRAVRPATQMALSYKNEFPRHDTMLDAVHAGAYAIDTRLGFGEDTRLMSSWFGVNRARKLRLLDLASQRVDTRELK